jgi:hypothetical protein
MNQSKTKPRAFLSCSLRKEDKDFVDIVEKITQHLGFHPFGTVGKYDAAPEPLWKQMKNGIKNADCIIMALTPRYLQQDIHDKKSTGHSISEMLHFELGMAVYKGIPIIALASDDKVFGKLLPSMVSIITLNPKDEADFYIKWPLIQNYYKKAMSIIIKKWDLADKKELVSLGKNILATIGAATLIYLFINLLTGKK